MANYTAMAWAELAISLGSVLLGLVVGYQAYRGFRRNDSRPMQYLSVGLILLTAVPFTMTFATSLAIHRDPSLAGFRDPVFFLARSAQFLGLVLITYSLYRKP